MRSASLLVGVIAGFGGCDSSGPPPSAGDACRMLFDGLRTRDLECGGIFGDGRSPTDRATLCDRLPARVTDGAIQYDGRQLAPCLDHLKGESCDQLSVAAPPACDLVFVGLGEPAKECLDGLECNADTFCLHPGGSCPGFCTPRATAGDACQSAACARGLSCSPTGETCVAPGEGGQGCAGGLCAPGFTCAAGTCMPKRSSGPCQSQGDCVPWYHCSAGRICEIDRAAGESCLGSYECGAGMMCAASVCRSGPVAGDPCGGLGDPPCLDGFCSGGTCARFVDEGAACALDAMVRQCTAATFCSAFGSCMHSSCY